MCTLLCFAIIIVGTMALFSFFTTWDGRTTNKIFIGINAGLCLFLSVVSVLICCGPSMTYISFQFGINLKKKWLTFSGETHSALLQSGIISVYITYLTWTAVSSIPREPTPSPESSVQPKGLMVRHHSNKACTLSRHFFVVVLFFVESNYDVFGCWVEQTTDKTRMMNAFLTCKRFYVNKYWKKTMLIPWRFGVFSMCVMYLSRLN